MRRFVEYNRGEAGGGGFRAFTQAEGKCQLKPIAFAVEQTFHKWSESIVNHI